MEYTWCTEYWQSKHISEYPLLSTISNTRWKFIEKFSSRIFVMNNLNYSIKFDPLPDVSKYFKPYIAWTSQQYTDSCSITLTINLLLFGFFSRWNKNSNSCECISMIPNCGFVFEWNILFSKRLLFSRPEIIVYVL